MECNAIDPLTQLSALLKYKELAKDPVNRSQMAAECSTINFLAKGLDTSDEEILKTSLDTLLSLCESPACIISVLSGDRIMERLDDIVNNEDLSNFVVREEAIKLWQLLKALDSPEMKPNKKILSKKKKVLTLHIHGLHLETQKELEDTLTKKMKGVHSVIVDVEHQKCTVTVYEHVDPKTLALVISENTEMEAKLISKNKYNQEILIPLIENDKTLDLDDLPPYLDEKDSPVKEKAVRSAKEIRITASEWFCSAVGILQRTFYW